ncbi:MAG: hypothetical protein VB934_14730, partial [Polyangiaceae bacterium]
VRELLGRLMAEGVAIWLADETVDFERLAARLSWLSAHTAIDALWHLDEHAAGDKLGSLWTAVGAHVALLDAEGRGRGEAACALAALRRSQHPEARAMRGKIEDSLLDASLRDSAPEAETAPARVAEPRRGEVVLSGERVRPPPSSLSLVLQAVTGVLLLRGIVYVISRWILRVERPIQLRFSPEGVTAKAELRLLGRTLRTAETRINISNLALAQTEIRFPRMGLYVGLTALAVGSYVGVKFMTEAVLVGSPSLIALGATVVGAGVMLDFLFSSLLPGRAEKRLVLLVPRRGAKLAVSTSDEGPMRAALDLID